MDLHVSIPISGHREPDVSLGPPSVTGVHAGTTPSLRLRGRQEQWSLLSPWAGPQNPSPPQVVAAPPSGLRGGHSPPSSLLR